MGILRKSKKERVVESRRKRKTGKEPLARQLLNPGRMLFVLSFLGLTALVTLICFFGLSPAGPRNLPNQVARIRVVAEIPFSYESEILTNQLIEERRRRLPPVYKLTLSSYRRFETYIDKLQEGLDGLEVNTNETGAAERMSEIRAFARNFEPDSGYNLNSENIAIILNEIESEKRPEVIREGILILREIYREGVYDSNNQDINVGSGSLLRLNIITEAGELAQVEVQSEEDALRFLRINMSALDIPREASSALFHLLRNGLAPNLEFDPAKTEELRLKVESEINPVVVKVIEGQTIIEPDTKVRPLELEQLAAYRQSLKADKERSLGFDPLLWERLLMTIGILISAAIYINVGSRQLRRHRQRILLSVTVMLVNLTLLRLTTELDFLADTKPSLTALLPFMAPTALGPILAAVLIGTGPGIFLAVLVSLFHALMQGNSMTLLMVSFLSTLLGIYYCHNVQVRARVVQAGALTGLSMAVCIFFMGLHAAFDVSVILEQMGVAIVIGVVTGIVVVGILPFFENLFKFTTDISLLELTDFNHPLLRRMQVTAPGTYHHSLMVANLSENAAAEIGANPLVCRVCSLFHDIGKMQKPDYFTENQREGFNPHILHNPSMSALVIKSHVKEGVQLARQYKLPQIIIDAIKEHHGTTLIQYFYYKALKQKESSNTPSIFPGAPRVEIDKVNESTYRYEGPKPQFKESAVIFFADSIEAASRCLPKVTPQAIDELLDRIFRSRLDDHQLSECALTFEEVENIKKSFSFTLLNMLHSRVEYPSPEEQQKAVGRAGSKSGNGGRKSAAKKKKDAPKESSTAPAQAQAQAQTVTPPTTPPTHAAAKEKATPHSGSQPV